jgi:lytic cellulose monooxygenase (C1-hydroxylating)
VQPNGRHCVADQSSSYLLRGELIALHEGDARYDVNPIRGAQFYPNCVQLQVMGDGTVELPAGVSFPGAYKYSDPGVHYDVSCPAPTTKCQELD